MLDAAVARGAFPSLFARRVLVMVTVFANSLRWPFRGALSTAPNLISSRPLPPPPPYIGAFRGRRSSCPLLFSRRHLLHPKASLLRNLGECVTLPSHVWVGVLREVGRSAQLYPPACFGGPLPFFHPNLRPDARGGGTADLPPLVLGARKDRIPPRTHLWGGGCAERRGGSGGAGPAERTEVCPVGRGEVALRRSMEGRGGQGETAALSPPKGLPATFSAE